MPNVSKVRLLIIFGVTACIFHAVLFHLRWYHNSGASVPQLIFSFWTAVALLSTGLIWIKQHKRLVITAFLLGALSLVPSASTCLNWTIWNVIRLVT